MPAKNPKEYASKHYKENIERYRESSRRSRDARKQWYQELIKDLKCEICGEDDPITFDWHHVDPTQKEHSISWMMKSRGKDAILAEIAKCQCLCANCHRKVHRDLRSGM